MLYFQSVDKLNKLFRIYGTNKYLCNIQILIFTKNMLIYIYVCLVALLMLLCSCNFNSKDQYQCYTDFLVKKAGTIGRDKM